jgi:hypothetical protein
MRPLAGLLRERSHCQRGLSCRMCHLPERPALPHLPDFLLPQGGQSLLLDLPLTILPKHYLPHLPGLPLRLPHLRLHRRLPQLRPRHRPPPALHRLRQVQPSGGLLPEQRGGQQPMPSCVCYLFLDGQLQLMLLRLLPQQLDLRCLLPVHLLPQRHFQSLRGLPHRLPGVHFLDCLHRLLHRLLSAERQAVLPVSTAARPPRSALRVPSTA